MTDNEIIKALECHSKNNVRTCKGCPYADTYHDINGECIDIMATEALALINRQKVTIEQLQTALFKCGEERVTARAEAVKEFAERLKEKIRDVAKIEFQDGYYYLIGVPLIDNLVKEFTEGDRHVGNT